MLVVLIAALGWSFLFFFWFCIGYLSWLGVGEASLGVFCVAFLFDKKSVVAWQPIKFVVICTRKHFSGRSCAGSFVFRFIRLIFRQLLFFFFFNMFMIYEIWNLFAEFVSTFDVCCRMVLSVICFFFQLFNHNAFAWNWKCRTRLICLLVSSLRCFAVGFFILSVVLAIFTQVVKPPHHFLRVICSCLLTY